ncbi:MAG: putative lipid II flippase FtsW [Oscillospiraceae bacterium]
MTREEHDLKKMRKQRLREIERERTEAARGPLDLPFFILVILLLSIGLVMLLSASFPSAYYKTGKPTSLFVRQGVFAVMGFALMLMISKINYQRFRGVAKIALFGSIILLILVIIPGLGITVKNSTRWLGVPGTPFQFQPSELAKLGVVLYFADSISKKKDKMRTFRYGIAPYALILLLIAGLMLLEPHLSGTVLILGAGAVMMLVGGIGWGWVAAVLGVAAVGGFFVIGVLGYGGSRLDMWRDPFIDSLGKGYQMCQSYLAIGSGGLLGVGLGRSRQKYLYLPEEHNDFIFAIICEELGLIGATLIMLLFSCLILRGFWIALNSRDRFGSLLVVGITTLVAMQTFLNIAVVSGAVPATGISLPFFSYGGTALCIQLAEMGIVLSVSRQMRAPPG